MTISDQISKVIIMCISFCEPSTIRKANDGKWLINYRFPKAIYELEK
ncbi:unnamed protein product, partial [Brugia timori]|uniref:Phage protein n=1 Tax=Brugia timori TaxID=42155 RepID=A0A0R3Q9J9_9BILA